MDPNRTLENIRSLIEAAHRDDAVIYEDGGWLFEMVEALDEWLSKGGFLPKEWAKTERLVTFRGEHKVVETDYLDDNGETAEYTVYVESVPWDGEED